ncbi:hypothetical protein SteCoe_25027 [Stentor coeruleus]|uniref:non-specific serine/threonine protein kinase n=1 Tax=Stentor coeruleus TaxID=5963 RepID=A0A1R2BG82_9CILI|nr:hypothetical protein SteCoe_25027 [Stentor coeruleus]
MDDDIIYRTLIYKRGNETAVYDGFLQKENKAVCIKIIYCASLADANNKLNESYTMNRVKDIRNIIKIYKTDIGQAQGRYFLRVIMDLFENGNLADLIKSRCPNNYWPEEDLLNYLTQLVEVFSILEERKVAHRDIKPENIFVSNDLKDLIVGDLGTAKEHFNLSETIAGTPMYLSPLLRQAYITFLSGSSINLQHDPFKSDVYSLGLTFLYMASLRECSDLLNLANLMEKTRQRIDELNWYPNLQPILRKMLTYSESDRESFKSIYQSLKKFNVNTTQLEKSCLVCCRIIIEEIINIGIESVCKKCWESFNEKLWTFAAAEYIDNTYISGYLNTNKCQYCKKPNHVGYSCFAFRNNPIDLKCGICSLSGNQFSNCFSNGGFWVMCQIGHNYCVVCNRGIGYNHTLCSLVMNTAYMANS